MKRQHLIEDASLRFIFKTLGVFAQDRVSNNLEVILYHYCLHKAIA